MSSIQGQCIETTDSFSVIFTCSRSSTEAHVVILKGKKNTSMLYTSCRDQYTLAADVVNKLKSKSPQLWTSDRAKQTIKHQLYTNRKISWSSLEKEHSFTYASAQYIFTGIVALCRPKCCTLVNQYTMVQ